ncbi:MAG: DUF5666 domain-containing protein, partial [Balneolaceae bacterium]
DNNLTDEELLIASQIIGESLSDESEGLFSSLNEAFTIPAESGFSPSAAKVGNFSGNTLNASATYDSTQSNYSYSYDPETGIHSVSFLRSVNQPNFAKETSSELAYIFYDFNGEFIAAPRMENERIETVDYSADRSGFIETPRKNSSYQRTGRFLTDGLSSGSDIIQIDGTHEGSGQFTATRLNGDQIERSYSLTIDFLNVQISKTNMNETPTLQRGVTGAVAYEMIITRTVNGNESTKTVNGTVEFNGDGTALLRFRDILDIFRIKLDDGRVFEEDEFEGYIQSVDLARNSFTLFSGQQILMTSNTEIDEDSDLSSLEEVESALNSGYQVEAEGEVNRRDDGVYVAEEVEFELEDDELEFEEDVESVNLDENSFTLKDGMTLYITDRSKINDDSDYKTLQEVSDALNNGLTV